MNKIMLDPSRNYKRQTWITAGYMAVFILTYLVMVLFAVALAALCLFGAISLIVSHPRYLVILFGIGIGALGLIVLSFLLKFLFKAHRVDRSGLYEIKKADEPQLFALLESLVREIGTRMPRRVYLSSEVNASVFYDSGFWNLFLPVRKNLNIGIGLVNALTKEEFRCVLAHEFGHFSQKTLRLYLYAYRFERITHNLLYNNESYEENVRDFANISQVFNLFSTIALGIVKFMQETLKVQFLAMKKAAMGLSREMEFDADAIAVQVAGVEASQSALLRLDFANFAYQSVSGFYQQLAAKQQKGKNLFSDYLFAMRLMETELGLKDTRVPRAKGTRSQQRLYVEDLWSSHPTTEERIEQMEKRGNKASSTENTPASTVFVNLLRYEEKITDKLFWNNASAPLTAEESQAAYREYFYSLRHPEIYKNYYYYRNPEPFDLNAPFEPTGDWTLEGLFSDRQVQIAGQASIVHQEIGRLEAISNGVEEIKTFYFDGAECTPKDCNRLMAELGRELEVLEGLLGYNDQQIFHFFKKLEEAANRPPRLEDLYTKLFDFDQKSLRFAHICEKFSITAEDAPMEEAMANFEAITNAEGQFKADIREILDLMADIAPQWPKLVKVMDKYLSADYTYLNENGYIVENVRLLENVLSLYPSLLLEWRTYLKRKLIQYQAELVNDQSPDLETHPDAGFMFSIAGARNANARRFALN
ncbi:MAG: M48 family metalloprotease [Saprospiraceae bacterium]